MTAKWTPLSEWAGRKAPAGTLTAEHIVRGVGQLQWGTRMYLARLVVTASGGWVAVWTPAVGGHTYQPISVSGKCDTVEAAQAAAEREAETGGKLAKAVEAQCLAYRW